MAPIPIESFTEGTKVLHLLIAPIIKEGDCSDACKFVARHCENGSSQIQFIYFYPSYSPVTNTESIIINIAIIYMHIINAIIFYVSNAFHNTNVPIHEILCVSPSPYYLDWI